VDSGQLAVVSEEKNSRREWERAEPFPAPVGSSIGGQGKRARMGFDKHGRE
jgi:hypothetical protein